MGGWKNRGGKSHREEKRRRKKISEKWREGHFEVSCEKIVGFGALLEVEMFKKCTPVSRRFRGKNAQKTRFGALESWDVQKVNAVVARSTFPSQNVKSTTSLGPLLDVEMSKNSTRLWPEAHAEVKMWKALQVWTTPPYITTLQLLLLLLQLQLQLQPKIPKYNYSY